MNKFALFAVLLSSLAFGQRDGVASFTAADVFSNDSVNLVTLVPSLNFTLLSKSQGALPGSINITSPQACQVTTTQKIVSCGSTGNNVLAELFFVPNELLGITTDASSTTAQGCTTYTIHHLIGTDSLSSYQIPTTTLHYPSGCGTTSATVTSNDNTGITATLTAGASTVAVTAPQNSSGVTSNNTTTVTDPFGNTVGLPGGLNSTFTDSLGAATVLTGNQNQPTAYQYTDTTGTSQNITTTNGTAATFVPLCGTNSTGSVTPISSINFPDSTSISFTWDTNGSGIDGLIKSFTLRTGGTITYTYGTLFQCVNGGVWAYNTLSRVTPDGTTTYSMSFASGLTTTTVLDPGKNKTVYVFIGSPVLPPNVLQSVTRYQNTGTVASPTYAEVSAESYCYNTTCGGTTDPTFPITTYEIKRYVGSGPTFMSDETQTFDSTYGNLLTDAITDEITSQTITTTYVYGTYSSGSCSAITNTAVVDHPCTITTKNGSTWLSESTYTYNSNGALTSSSVCLSSTCTGSSALTTAYTRNSTGTPATITLPNGRVITNTFGSCNSLMLTDSTTTVSVTIDNKASWNCDAGVVTDTTDPNSNEDDYTYDSMNRLSTYTDRLENVTSYAYGSPTLDHVKVTDPLSVVSYVYNDGLGRPTNSQVCQTTGCSNLDTSSTSYAWNGTNFETKTYVPCVKTTLNAACTAVALTADSNPVFGPVSTTDANSGTLTWARNSKDWSLTAGPAPSQENTKVVQTEVDGFGRLTSTCALTATGYNGRVACGQTMGNNGTLTSNVYSFDATTGAPKVVATRGSQSHTTIADALGRITSVQTPEGGTVTDTYDTVSALDSCYAANATSPGNLMHHTNADSSYNCLIYDGLQRLTDVKNSSDTTTNPCKRYRYDSTANKYVAAPTGYPASPYIEGRLFEAETDNCAGTPTTITDEWFAYDKMGRVTDYFQWSTNSGGYYHTTVVYNADGTVTSMTLPGSNSFTFGVDGEDRPFNMEFGTTWIVGSSTTTGVSYDAASRPLTVPLSSSGDGDTYTYDNVGNMTEYTFSVNSTTDDGKLTYNSIGSLNKLVITDGFNSGGSMTCTYGTASPAVEGYDDVGRLLDANCGSLIQHDSWTYDQYDNATRTGNPGTSWNPGYSSTTNQMTGSTYDSNGNLKYDGVNSYSWNVYNKMVGTVSGNHTISCTSTNAWCSTYDAFGRLVEIFDPNGGGLNYENLYSPIGRVALMSGSTVSQFYIPAPGGGYFYQTGGTNYFAHPDWLGTIRLVSSISGRTFLNDMAFTPYGESFDTFGTVTGGGPGGSLNFTGDTQWSNGLGLWDTPNRELATNSSRWLSPDPAHVGWNAYAYPTDPNTQTDPSGLDPQTGSTNEPQPPGPCVAYGGGSGVKCEHGQIVVPRTVDGTGAPLYGESNGTGETVNPAMTAPRQVGNGARTVAIGAAVLPQLGYEANREQAYRLTMVLRRGLRQGDFLGTVTPSPAERDWIINRSARLNMMGMDEDAAVTFAMDEYRMASNASASEGLIRALMHENETLATGIAQTAANKFELSGMFPKRVMGIAGPIAIGATVLSLEGDAHALSTGEVCRGYCIAAHPPAMAQGTVQKLWTIFKWQISIDAFSPIF